MGRTEIALPLVTLWIGRAFAREAEHADSDLLKQMREVNPGLLHSTWPR